VDFSANGVLKTQGWSAPAPPTASGLPIRGMGQLIENDGSSHIYLGDRADLYRYDGGATVALLTGTFTGIEDETATQLATTWSMIPFGDWMICSNGVDVPQVIKGSAANPAALAGVAGNFTTAEILAAQNEHILALNTNNSPYEIRWCDSGDPEDWTPTASNTAGFLAIREARSPIMAGVPLQQFTAIYTREGLFLLEYIGSTTVRFRYLHSINGIGALSKQSVVEVGRLNYGVGQQGFWRTDGNSFAYIDEPAVRQEFVDNLLVAQASKVCSQHNEEETTVWWYYPTADEPNKGLGFNYVNQSWSVRNFGRTSALERNVFDDPYSADNTGTIYRDNNTDDAAGTPITAFVRTKGLSFGDETISKTISHVRVNYQGAGLRLRMGYKNAESDGAITWNSYVEVTSGDLIPVDVGGKLIFLELQSQDAADAWEVFAVDFYGRFAGTREAP
jgi:hypothetical protein